MKRNVMLGAAAAAVALILVWYFLLYSPLGDDLTATKAQVATEQKQAQDLQATLDRLESQKKNAPQQQALLNRLDKAVPKTADLAEFIVQANDIADQSGIDFLTIAPSPPAAGNGASVINLTITLQGGFFQLQDYLQSLEKLGRLVIIDTINVSGSGGSSSSAGSAASADTSLSVTLTGRMFTRAAPTGTAGGTPGATTPAPGGTSSTTAPAAGGSTSSTSAPSGSSTTGGT